MYRVYKHSDCCCSMPATAKVAHFGTDLIYQLDREGPSEIYIHVVHWVDLYAIYWATHHL